MIWAFLMVAAVGVTMLTPWLIKTLAIVIWREQEKEKEKKNGR